MDKTENKEGQNTFFVLPYSFFYAFCLLFSGKSLTLQPKKMIGGKKAVRLPMTGISSHITLRP